MNKARRQSLAKIAERLDTIKSELEDIQIEEQEFLDGIPGNLQSGERYTESEEAISNIEEAIDNLESAFEIINVF